MNINLINQHKGKRPTTSSNAHNFDAFLYAKRVHSERFSVYARTLYDVRCRCSALHLYSHQSFIRPLQHCSYPRRCTHFFVVVIFKWMQCMRYTNLYLYFYIFITCNERRVNAVQFIHSRFAHRRNVNLLLLREFK